jgi:hypothetical protein
MPSGAIIVVILVLSIGLDTFQEGRAVKSETRLSPRGWERLLSILLNLDQGASA